MSRGSKNLTQKLCTQPYETYSLTCLAFLFITRSTFFPQRSIRVTFGTSIFWGRIVTGTISSLVSFATCYRAWAPSPPFRPALGGDLIQCRDPVIESCSLVSKTEISPLSILRDVHGLVLPVPVFSSEQLPGFVQDSVTTERLR